MIQINVFTKLNILIDIEINLWLPKGKKGIN